MANEAGEETEIKRVEVDALEVLQIMKHCRQYTPGTVTGMLLGLDVNEAVQVTHCFGYVQKGQEEERVQDDGEQYQYDMLRRLREVNVDSNTVGWYQTTHLGQFFSSTMIDTQYNYQATIPHSILLVYDPLQSAIGKPAFKALRLTPQFMAKRTEELDMNKSALSDFPSGEMFTEIPIVIQSTVIIEAFLVDWALMDPISTTQIEALDVENQAFLERNIELLNRSLEHLAEEQAKMQSYERNAGRQAQQDKGKGRDRYRNQPVQPRPLDTMILSQQIQNYCKQINDFSSDSFGKLFLLSNKPAGLSRST